MKKRTRHFGYGKYEQRLEAKAVSLMRAGQREASNAVARELSAHRAAARERGYQPRHISTGIPAPRHGYRYEGGKIVRR